MVDSIGLAAEQRGIGLSPRRTRVIWIAVTTLAVVGCGRQSPTPTALPTPGQATPSASPIELPASPAAPLASDLRGNVSIWLDWGPAATAMLADLVSEFRTQHPAVSVSLTYYRPEDLRSAFDDAVRTGRQPTILVGPSSWGPSLASKKTLLEIGPRVMSELIDRMQPLAWSQSSYAGAVVGLPLNLEGVVLYRNRALAAQPASDFEAWLKSARAVSDKFPREPVLDVDFQFSGSQLAACGGTLLKAGGGIGFDETTGICWLGLLARFRDAGPLTLDSTAALNTFAAGHSPWLIGLTSDEISLRTSIGSNNLAIDPWPAFPPTGKPLAGFVWTENAYMIAGASPQDQDAAWALLISLLSPEVQTRFAAADGPRWLPVLKSVAPGDALQGQALAELTAGVALPLAADLTVYSTPLGRAVWSVAGQGADPGVALKRATELIHNQLSISPPGG